MRSLFTALVLIGTLLGAVDIVGCPSGVFVVWEQNYIVRLTDIDGSQDTLDFGLYTPTIGCATMGSEPLLVLTTSDYGGTVDDSLFLIDPSPLSVVSCRGVASTDLCWLSETGFEEGSIRAARHQNEEDAFYISADAYLPISGGMECNVISARFVCDTAGDIYITDTLGVSIDTYSGSINSYTRPAACAISVPSQFWTYQNGYGTPAYSVYSGAHQIDGPPVPGDFEPMLHDCFYNVMDVGGEFRAIGSCATEVIGFWTTEEDLSLCYSVLQPGAVEPDSSEAAPYDIPVMAAIAMSQNPDDYGLLLVWQDGSEIRCGHWDGEWNGYCHVVETGVAGLYNGGLAVCSVDSGYFVAWETADLPEIRFIPRDIVTSVEGPQGSILPADLTVSPNPAPHGTTVTATVLAGMPPYLDIYDITGRLVDHLETEGLAHLTIETTGMFPGTYILRAGTGEADLTEKLLILRR